MQTQIIITAITIIALFCTHTSAYSQGCHGMNNSSGGHDHNASAGKSESTAGASSTRTVTYYVCPMHPEIVNNKPGKCPKCDMELIQKTSGIEKTELQKDTVIYTCSMHPEVQSDKPGDCPKCGMALVKKSEVSGKKMMCPMMMGGMKDMNKTENKEKDNSTK